MALSSRFIYLALAILSLVILVIAHPGDEEEIISEVELERRSIEASKRQAGLQKCAREIAEYEEARRIKRAKEMKRDISFVAPRNYYDTIQNNTCVLAPEVTEGPYYVRNELYRQDLRESQAGVKLVLDVGVIDTVTCKPAPNVLVEIWACNAVGTYGGVGSATGASFLRGGYETNTNGVVELTTIYPGFYTGRTIHIHTMLHQSWAKANNGSILSGSGYVRHIGQFFFDESLNDKVVALPAYTATTQRRTLNSQDGILQSANGNGYSAFVSTQLLGSTVSDGILGYITVGIDSRASYRITSTAYYPRMSKRELGLGSYHEYLN